MEVLSTVAAAEPEDSRRTAARPSQSCKLSALDWEEELNQKAFSAISRRF